MAVMSQSATSGYITRAPRSSGLADVLEVILDRGLVIDAFVRVSLVGIELLTIDLRIVVASVDTYLRFAEAVGRLNIEQSDQSKGLPELVEDMTEGGSKSKTKGAVEGVKEKIGLGEGRDDEGRREKSRTRRRQRRDEDENE